jgi:hypothetical protein
VNPFPQQNYTSPFMIAGQALGQAGQDIGDYEDRQARLKQLFMEMQQKKAMALIQARAAEDESKAREQDTAEKAAQLKRNQDFSDFVQGQVVSPTQAANPDLSQPTQKPAPSAGPIQSASSGAPNGQNTNIPNQTVKAGPDASQMMNDAATSSITGMDGANGRFKPTREEVALKALQTQQPGALGEYINVTNPWLNMDPMTKARLQALGRLHADDSPYQQDAVEALGQYATQQAAKHKPPNKGEALAILSKIDPTGSVMNDRTVKSHLAMMLPQDPDLNPFVKVMQERVDLANQKYNETAHDENGLALRPPTPAQADRVVALTKSAHELLLLTNLINSIPEAQRGIIIGKITKNNPYSGTVAQIKNLVTSLGGKMPQALEGVKVGGSEKLTAEHQAMIPALDNSIEAAKAKVDLLYNELPSAYQQFVGSLKDDQRNTAPYESIQSLEDMANYHLSPSNQVKPNPGAYRPPSRDLLGPGAPNEPPPTPARGRFKPIDAATAADYLKRAGGDRAKAKTMLAKDGYNVNG